MESKITNEFQDDNDMEPLRISQGNAGYGRELGKNLSRLNKYFSYCANEV